ncbi:50S ribosomal protein L25 [Desulfonatronospira sp.]|uniref:50S ribosomal protein L25 n=1 Tax=Desulfonatronospira sp. TaxID=1962951 RepID=UPI0025C0CE31|nr:50S ribosomal protein L25 [Desulfonatronospira sp.]
MSELYNLKVEVRNETGKSSARKLRKSDYIPGVYYDSQGATLPLKVRNGPFYKAWNQVGTTNVVELEYFQDGESYKKPCLIWSIDRHPYKKIYMHVDFYGVDLTKEVTVAVPVEVKGTPKGAEDDGVINIFRETLDLTCLPANIPSQVVIDVSKLEIGDNIYIEDLKLPAGAKVTYEENFAVVGLIPPMQEEPEAEAEEEEVQEGAEDQEPSKEEQPAEE